MHKSKNILKIFTSTAMSMTSLLQTHLKIGKEIEGKLYDAETLLFNKKQQAVKGKLDKTMKQDA